MGRNLAFLIVLLALLAPGAAMADFAHLQKLNYFETVSGQAGACTLSIAMKDRAGFGGASVATKGNELHVMLPNTYTDPPVRSFGKLENACFAKAIVAQVDTKTVRAILQFHPDYAGEKQAHLTIGTGVVNVEIGPAPVVPVAPPVVSAPAAAVAEPTPEVRSDLAELLNATPIPAAAPTEKATADEPELGSDLAWGEAATKMAVALAFSLGVLFLLVALAKRLKLPARLTGSRGGMIRVVHTGMLDMKRRIAVVDIAGELIVVALTGNDVTMLTKIESPEARDRLLGKEERGVEPDSDPAEPFVFGPDDGERAAPAPASFGSRLRAYTRHAPKESVVAGHETLTAIAERVRGLKRL